MADNQKQSDFISRVRQAATQYRDNVDTLRQLDKEYQALYTSLLNEDDFIGANIAIIPSGDPATRLNSLVSVIANAEAIITAFDAGIATNFERITN